VTQASTDDRISRAEQLFDQGCLEEAEELAAQLLERAPGMPRLLQLLGIVRSRRGRPLEAIPLLERAISIEPAASAHNELGLAFGQFGNCDRAIRHFEQALILQPDYAFAHLNRSLANLKSGRFREGWVEYEWRFKSGLVSRPEIPVPRWDGSPLAGKRLLIHTEQGIGDVLQFVRFLPLLKRQGAQIALACPPALRPLLRSLAGIDEWVPIDTPTEMSFDYYTPLLSLPALLRIDNEAAIPNHVPYIDAETVRIEKWRRAFDKIDGFRIGICWQGSPTFRGDGFRSIPLEHFAPLAQLDSCNLICLQKGHGIDQVDQQAARIPLHVYEHMDEEGAFLDTAAMMHSLDLIITSDTAVAHLAGALGRPTWLALSTASDWRWSVERTDSYWYPTMRLFRQRSLGDWSGVFSEMVASLGTSLPRRGRSGSHVHRPVSHSSEVALRRA
jgi:hypothetical protein